MTETQTPTVFTYNHLTFEEFNKTYQLNAKREMDVNELTQHIESKLELNYFSASLNDLDVSNEILEHWKVARKLKLEYVCIEGVFAAIAAN